MFIGFDINYEANYPENVVHFFTKKPINRLARNIDYWIQDSLFSGYTKAEKAGDILR